MNDYRAPENRKSIVCGARMGESMFGSSDFKPYRRINVVIDTEAYLDYCALNGNEALMRKMAEEMNALLNGEANVAQESRADASR